MTAQEQNALVELLVDTDQVRIAEIRSELHQSVEEALARVANSFLLPQDIATEPAGSDNGHLAEEHTGHTY